MLLKLKPLNPPLIASATLVQFSMFAMASNSACCSASSSTAAAAVAATYYDDYYYCDDEDYYSHVMIVATTTSSTLLLCENPVAETDGAPSGLVAALAKAKAAGVLGAGDPRIHWGSGFRVFGFRV